MARQHIHLTDLHVCPLPHTPRGGPVCPEAGSSIPRRACHRSTRLPSPPYSPRWAHPLRSRYLPHPRPFQRLPLQCPRRNSSRPSLYCRTYFIPVPISCYCTYFSSERNRLDVRLNTVGASQKPSEQGQVSGFRASCQVIVTIDVAQVLAILMEISKQFRTTGRARLRLNWYKFKAKDVFKCF
ncbi:hypothetical protein T484DRAFT_2517507 [Baffinella frigidus]|nr:hypothetical protein T484DRAFT_2517507 [Cryptophyta sp. CCMP2293]